MKLVNKIGFALVGLIVALVLSMLQVQAEENTDQEQSMYFASQKSYENGELVKDVTYYFWSSVATEKVCFVAHEMSGGTMTYSLHYFDELNNVLFPLIVTSDSYFRSNLPPYEEKDFSSLRNPSISLESGSRSGNKVVYSFSCSFGNLKVFSDSDAAKAYFKDGDDSGWINKPEPEEFNYFSLSGFQYDDSIYASWSGIQTDLQLIKNHVDDVEVVVSPSFFLILEPGEKYEKFKDLENLVIPLSGSFKGSYDSFFEDNPYKGRALLTLDFYPRYYDSATGNMYRGDSISVRFDAKGKITDVELPESSLIPVYDPGCYFDSPASTTMIIPDSLWKTFFRWNKVATSYVYKSNYIAVDIGYDGKWYPYSNDDFFSSNSISLTFVQVTALVRDLVPDADLLNGYKLRYTPYYKTSTGFYYGKPIIVSVSKNGESESITEVDGDYLDNTKLPDYIDKTPTDWFEDSTLWDNVEQVTDHIKDDLDGTVDLDNLSFNFFKMLKSVINACGQFPALVSTVFSFLPADISKLLVISFSLIIIMRILGR